MRGNDQGEKADLLSIHRQDHSVTINNPGKNTGFVLIKRRSFLSVVYFLEIRDKDDSYAERYGLYGGTQDTDKDEFDYKDIAARELRDELDIPAQPNDLQELGFVHSYRENGQSFSSEIFKLDHLHRKHLHFDKLKSAAIKNSKANDLVGRPKKIRRVFYGWWWFSAWHKLTPPAAFALLTDTVQDKRRKQFWY